MDLITVFITFKVAESCEVYRHFTVQKINLQYGAKYNQVVNAYLLSVSEGIVQNDQFLV